MFNFPQGTSPFISPRLLFAWSGDTPIIHTAIDDLNAFVWVIIWALLLVGIRQGQSSATELYKIFNSQKTSYGLFSLKYGMEAALGREGFPPPCFHPILKLLLDLFGILSRAERKLDDLLLANNNEINGAAKKHIGDTYIKFLTRGLKPLGLSENENVFPHQKLSNTPRSWYHRFSFGWVVLVNIAKYGRPVTNTSTPGLRPPPFNGWASGSGQCRRYNRKRRAPRGSLPVQLTFILSLNVTREHPLTRLLTHFVFFHVLFRFTTSPRIQSVYLSCWKFE